MGFKTRLPAPRGRHAGVRITQTPGTGSQNHQLHTVQHRIRRPDDPRSADTILSIITTRLRNIPDQLYPPKNSAMPSETSVVSSGLRWLQRKRYQYEVTFSLYMLTPTEKFIFSMSTHSSRCAESIYFRWVPKPGLPLPSIRPLFNPSPHTAPAHGNVLVPALITF